ncbi:MAG: hypothetical protein GX907_04690 [Clostridiaceae bacterium]|mgnify:CR=1 FL=1|nr:hypothetical protein [Clostridiaceae bacterium]
MENAIRELRDVIQQMNIGFDWTSAISAVCSVISLLAIFVLLKERGEKKRPYVQVSFELVKSSLVCLVIRNVGEVPATLKKLHPMKIFLNSFLIVLRNVFWIEKT